jgi:flagellar FliL protein
MKKLLKYLPRVALILVLIPVAGILIFMAYINFAMACAVFDPATLPAPVASLCGEPTEGQAAEDPGKGEGTAHEAETSHAASPQAEPESQTETKSEAPSAPVKIKPGQGLMVDTGTKIVNLVDPTGRRYLRVGIVLEFAPEDLTFYTMEGEEKALFLEEFNSELNAKLPVINDIVITILSIQTYDSVYTAEGKEALRNKIMETINTQLPEYRVIFVYFTEFVVQ